MAAIAPSEPYSIFIRKIGWSVGLEDTFSRVRDLVQLYVADKEISPASWDRLVRDEKNGWGLQTNNIADFFNALQLIKVQKREVHVLPCLDALALAYLDIENDQQFSDALKFILGSQLILADGDIFLNFLAGQFAREKVEPLLRGMILEKRARLLNVVRAPQLSERVIRSISIDVQHTNMGGAAVGKSLSETKRTTPLASRTAPLSSRLDPQKVEISDDYFRKVTGRRRDWARSLGLIDNDLALTKVGTTLLSCFRRAMGCSDDGPITCWPLSLDLERLHLLPEKLSIPRISLWDHICTVREGLKFDAAGTTEAGSATQEVFTQFESMYASYRRLCPKRDLLRREIPIGVFFHAVVACYIAKCRPLPDLRSTMEALGSDSSGSIIYRNSKNFEATISLRA
ncbi:MAG: hypothetical protein FD157_892 [Rhodocyclaceae bacterium]|nr:MAG: hypothetical protein FD157_892 [Rhodocyclaceae bacterium]TND05147.1 MAG: hypothetical protein FD118_551 [Rhodocyclaceae bacterium]